MNPSRRDNKRNLCFKNCFGIKFNLLHRCMKCPEFEKCGKVWITKESERTLTKIMENMK